MTPREFTALRKVEDLQDRYQPQPDPTQDGVFRLLGAPVTVTSRVPDTTGSPATGRAALVDFSQIAVPRDVAPSVKVLTETFGDYESHGPRLHPRQRLRSGRRAQRRASRSDRVQHRPHSAQPDVHPTVSYQILSGWTLAELAVLNRCRKRAM